MQATLICHHCQATWACELPLSRNAECPGCRRDSKVCLNCRFYDLARNRQCREPQASLVQTKDRSNFCEYFFPGAGGADANEGATAARSQLGKFFGETPEKSEASTGKDQPLSDLEKLFRK